MAKIAGVRIWALMLVAATCADTSSAVESIHFGYTASHPAQTDAIRLSTRIGTAYWSQNRQNVNPENGADIPYAYHDGYIEDLGTTLIPTAAAMAQRWRNIMTGQGDSRTGVSGASIGEPDLIILDELNSNFEDANRGPLFREALRLYTLPVAQGGFGGSRNDIVAYMQPGLSQGTGVTNGRYDDVIFAANNYMRALALEVYATEDGFRTGIESTTNSTQYPTGDAYLGVRLTGPLRNWMNRGLSETRLHPILNVSNIADANVNRDFNSFLNREFWFMANGRYSDNPTQVDLRIQTAMRRGVGSYTWAADVDNDDDPYQLLTAQVARDAYFESLLAWYSAVGNTSTYFKPNGDYDFDGSVDGVDFLHWQRAFGANSGVLTADGNANGAIDGGDLQVWAMNLGSSVFSASTRGISIPEPGAVEALRPIVAVLLVLSSRYFRGAARVSEPDSSGCWGAPTQACRACCRGVA